MFYRISLMHLNKSLKKLSNYEWHLSKIQVLQLDGFCLLTNNLAKPLVQIQDVLPNLILRWVQIQWFVALVSPSAEIVAPIQKFILTETILLPRSLNAGDWFTLQPIASSNFWNLTSNACSNSRLKFPSLCLPTFYCCGMVSYRPVLRVDHRKTVRISTRLA